MNLNLSDSQINVSILYLVAAFIVIFITNKFLWRKQQNPKKVIYDTIYRYFLKREEQESIGVLEKLLRTRKIRARFWLVFLGFIPASIISFSLGKAFFIFYFLFPIWIGLFFYIVFRWYFFICPRCRQFFHFSQSLGNPWTRRCLHCGLDIKEQNREQDREQDRENRTENRTGHPVKRTVKR